MMPCLCILAKQGYWKVVRQVGRSLSVPDVEDHWGWVEVVCAFDSGMRPETPDSPVCGFGRDLFYLKKNFCYPDFIWVHNVCRWF